MAQSTNDPVDLYLREMCASPPLAPTEEANLVNLLQSGGPAAEAARIRLLQANLAPVVSIAQSHAGQGIPVLDLIQHGNLALLQVVQSFPNNSTEPFSVQAANAVQEALSKISPARG